MVPGAGLFDTTSISVLVKTGKDVANTSYVQRDKVASWLLRGSPSKDPNTLCPDILSPELSILYCHRALHAFSFVTLWLLWALF